MAESSRREHFATTERSPQAPTRRLPSMKDLVEGDFSYRRDVSPASRPYRSRDEMQGASSTREGHDHLARTPNTLIHEEIRRGVSGGFQKAQGTRRMSGGPSRLEPYALAHRDYTPRATPSLREDVSFQRAGPYAGLGESRNSRPSYWPYDEVSSGSRPFHHRTAEDGSIFHQDGRYDQTQRSTRGMLTKDAMQASSNSADHVGYRYTVLSSSSDAMMPNELMKHSQTIRSASKIPGKVSEASLLPTQSLLTSAEEFGDRNASTGFPAEDDSFPRKLAKTHVPSACLNCKRAHLACDLNRPCRRCMNLGKIDTCIDVPHKKRGRPRLRERATTPVSRSNTEGTAATAWHEVEYRSMPSVTSAVDHTSSSGHSLSKPRGGSGDYVSASGMPTSPEVRYSEDERSAAHNLSRSIHHSLEPPDQDHRSALVAAHGRAAYPTAASMVLSTNLRCVRASVECEALFGCNSQDLVETSLFDLVMPEDSHYLERIWLHLIEPVDIKPGPLGRAVRPSTLASTPSVLLLESAPGTIFLHEQLRLRHPLSHSQKVSIRISIGGAFGTDLYSGASRDRAYIVASFASNDLAHPPPEMLEDAARRYRFESERTPALPAFQASTDSAAEQRRAAFKDMTHLVRSGRPFLLRGPIDADGGGSSS